MSLPCLRDDAPETSRFLRGEIPSSLEAPVARERLHQRDGPWSARCPRRSPGPASRPSPIPRMQNYLRPQVQRRHAPLPSQYSPTQRSADRTGLQASYHRVETIGSCSAHCHQAHCHLAPLRAEPDGLRRRHRQNRSRTSSFLGSILGDGWRRRRMVTGASLP